jgi:hypothetical protein
MAEKEEQNLLRDGKKSSTIYIYKKLGRKEKYERREGKLS